MGEIAQVSHSSGSGRDPSLANLSAARFTCVNFGWRRRVIGDSIVLARGQRYRRAEAAGDLQPGLEHVEVRP
jgi:hypothetical protein